MAERRDPPVDGHQPVPSELAADDGARLAARRRAIDEVFGDVLPDATSDERGARPDDSRDEELLRDVPPHHG